MSKPVNSNTFYINVYDKLDKTFSAPSQITQYEVLNPLKTGLTSRSDEGVISMRNLLFEFDELTLEEQKKIIEKNKQYINRVVFSGNKSFHVRITLLEEPDSKEEYKFIWKKINENLFSGNADSQCKNPSRLTRCPGAIRKDSKKNQILYFYNENQFFDASRYHSDFVKYINHHNSIKSSSINYKQNYKTSYENLRSVAAQNILNNCFPCTHRTEILSKGIPVLLNNGYSIDEIKEHILTISEPDRRSHSLRFLKWFENRTDTNVFLRI